MLSKNRINTDTLTSSSQRNQPALPNLNMHVEIVQRSMCLTEPPALPKIQHADHVVKQAIWMPDVKASPLHRRRTPAKSNPDAGPEVTNPVAYLALYEGNTDMHLSVYLFLCANEVLVTVSAHVYIYICGAL